MGGWIEQGPYRLETSLVRFSPPCDGSRKPPLRVLPPDPEHLYQRGICSACREEYRVRKDGLIGTHKIPGERKNLTELRPE